MLLVETVFLTSQKQFFPLFIYSWLWNKIFRQVETYFLRNSLFRLVKTDFLSSGKSFFFIQNFAESFERWRCQFLFVETNLLIFWLVELIFSICQILLLVKAIFRFLNKSSNPYDRDAFSVLWKPFSLIQYFFSKSGNHHWNWWTGKSFFWRKASLQTHHVDFRLKRRFNKHTTWN